MALRVGEMMVIIRAQDFASRTLRRVGSEFTGLSREQRMQAMREQVALNKARAAGRVALAESNARRLNYVRNGVMMRKELTAQIAALERFEAAQKAAMKGGRFVAGRPPGTMKEFRDASRALDQMGLRAQATFRRVDRARQAIATGAATGKGARANARELANATRAARALTSEQVQQALEQEKLSKSVGRYQTRLGGLSGTLQRAATNVGFMGNELFKSRRELQAAYQGLTDAQRAEIAFNNALRAMPAERLDRVAHALSGVGRTLQLFGAVGVAAFGLAAHAAANFDTQMSLAATQARDLGASSGQIHDRMEQLENGLHGAGQEVDGVLDLMSKYPASADQMSKATYDIFSSMDLEHGGAIDVAKGLGLLADANKIAVAGGVDLNEATSAMITVLNNFDPHLQNTTKQFDTMFNIVRFGRMTMSEFNIMMNKIAPAAADAGNSLKDVGGAMAFLTTVMPSQRMVATGISRLLEFLRHPDTVAGLKKFGVDAKDTTGKLRPLDKILEDIANRFPQVTTGQKSAAEFFREITAAGRGGGRGIIGTQEGRRAFSELMTHLTEYFDAQRRVEKNTKEFARAQAAQMKSLGVQWGIFVNQVKALALAIGQDAIPVFAQLGEVAQRLMNFWKGLDPQTRKMIVSIGVLASIGALLGGVFLTIGGALMSLEAMFRRIIPGIGKATGTLGAFRMALARLGTMAAIAVVFNVMMKGNATGMDLLQGAMAGAAMGSVFGPEGAIVGAITIPVIMKAMTTNQDLEDMMADQILKRTHRQGEKARAYGRYLAANIKAGAKSIMTRKEYEEFFDLSEKLDKLERNRFQTDRRQTMQNSKDKVKATKKYKDELGSYYKKLQEYDKSVKDFNSRLKDWRANLENATEQGTETAVSNLRNMYTEMLQANEQAFGQFAQGPWLTSETFDLAKEWGIEPGVKDLIKDLNMQNNDFRKWRRNLDAVMKKGLPKDLVDEIRKMPIEQGNPILENLRNAKPGQIQRLISEWKVRQKQIKSATKMDFRDEIERFRKAGGNMGKAIMDGFEAAQVGLFFDRWVKREFPDAINAAVAEARRDFLAQNPRPQNRPTNRPEPPVPPAGATKTNRGGVGTRARKASEAGTTHYHEGDVHITIPAGERGGPEMAKRIAWELKHAKRKPPTFKMPSILPNS